VKNILRYLKGTSETGIMFGRDSLNVYGYCDADWANDIDTRRSVTGFAFIRGTVLDRS